MATGIECVGIVLGVLPLVIEAAKAYSEGVDSILDVVVKDRYDQQLENFYLDFYVQVVHLESHINDICGTIATDVANKAKVEQSTKIFSQWQDDPELEKSLRKYFGTEDRYNEFMVISPRITLLLASLVRDDTTNISSSEKDQRLMFQNLKRLSITRQQDLTSSTFMKRFRFSTRQKKRDRYIKELNFYNDWLRKLIKRTEKALNQSTNRAASTKVPRSTSLIPTLEARNLAATLHGVLCSHQGCLCAEDRKIKLCLEYTQETTASDSKVCIDFLVSCQSQWQEGNVTVTSNQTTNCNIQQDLSQICEAFNQHLPDFSVQILVNDTNGQRSIWKLQPRPRRLKFIEASGPVTLHELLSGSMKLTMKEKRRLALTLVYCLLLYHDSDWLANGCTKEDITFFQKTDEEPDLERPFLNGVNRNSPVALPTPKPAVFHRNPNILALGILLVEIFDERPIEARRTPKERSSFMPNTDWLVAQRITERMDDTPCRAAIEACLSMDWLPQMQSAQLTENDVRIGVLNNVIAPLQQEVKWLTVN